MVLPAKLKKKEEALLKGLCALEKAAVSFSGGTDSTLLLFEAVRALGKENVLVLTALSEVYPAHEENRVKRICKQLKIQPHFIRVFPLKSKEFTRNTKERCYICKSRLFKTMKAYAKKQGFSCIIEGAQMDDKKDFRPGARAVKENRVLSPLMDAKLNKEEVRVLSRHHNLETADLPAYACLASRLPYGVKITPPLLARIEEGEEKIKALGFTQFRLRHHGNVARLELDPKEMELGFKKRAALTSRLKSLGWKYVCLDLQGYRQGALNEELK